MPSRPPTLRHARATQLQPIIVRPSPAEEGYDHHWRQVRARILRNQPLCVDCHSMSRVTAAVLVHHIIPLPEGSNDDANLAPLCRSCHGRRHGEIDRAKSTP